jgi:hypothetical protein
MDIETLVVHIEARVLDIDAKCERCAQHAFPEDTLTDYSFTDGSKRRLHGACLDWLQGDINQQFEKAMKGPMRSGIRRLGFDAGVFGDLYDE